MVQPIGDDQPGIRSGTGDILGAGHLVGLALDIAGFRSWLASDRRLNASADIFDGYVFGLRTVVRLLHQAIDFDFSLDLSEDYVLIRARNRGVPI